ncbi:unnamed protein product [Symbiodinium sp. CCMP2456]|nr:unnamed protein product [Symbiodinium sp. CCMP2456]
MDQLGATSLASRMCAGDATLSYATAQESIISEIRLYSAGLPIMNVGSMGAILCLLCLTVWWLQILRELWSAVCFGEGCISLPTRTTRLTPTDSGSFRLTSISLSRKIFVVAVIVVRFAVAVTLGAVGTLFLLNTGSIQEVVLNAVALGFILETDELFYDTLVPKGVKAVKDVIEPLPLLESTRWGSYMRAGITVVVCTVLLVVAGTNLNDTLSHMRAIEEEMCGGRKNFVVGLGTAIDTSYAVEIRELDDGGVDAGVDFGGAAQARLRSDGVRDLVASLVRMPQLVDEPRMVASGSLGDFLNRMTNPASQAGPELGQNTCTDVQRFNELIITGQSMLLQMGKKPSSCTELAPFCDGPEQFNARLVCPETCGCNDPMSGQLLLDAQDGCPRPACEATSTFQESLQNISCQDRSAESLRADPAWNREWSINLAYMGRLSKRLEVYYTAVKDLFMAAGCAAINHPLLWHPGFDRDWCVEARGIPKFALFCPETCGCASNSSSGLRRQACPPSCSSFT